MSSTCVFRTKFTTRYTTWSATRIATWHPRTWPTSRIWSRSLRKRWGCTRPYRCLPDNSRRTSESVSRICSALTCRLGKGEGVDFSPEKTAGGYRFGVVTSEKRETRGSSRTKNQVFFSRIKRVVFFRNIPHRFFPKYSADSVWCRAIASKVPTELKNPVKFWKI